MSEPVHLSPPMSQDVPKLIIFDLDDTVWYPELYMMCGAPWTRDELGRVTDVCDEELSICPRRSRGHRHDTSTRGLRGNPRGGGLAHQSRALGPGGHGSPVRRPRAVLREAAGDLCEIYVGSKRRHFQALRDKTSVAYRHMLFFDNEGINCEEVGQLGVCCVHCPGGMSQGAWEKGLSTYASGGRGR